MAQQGKNRKFIKRLKNKYRLVIMNDETLQERASVVLKPINVFTLISVLIVIFTTAIVLLLFYTPLKEYIPGYDKTDYLRLKQEQDRKIDSLDRVNRQYFDKWKNIEMILNDRFDSTGNPVPKP